MKFSNDRLAAFIKRDPVAVIFSTGDPAMSENTVTTTGLLHRRKQDRSNGNDKLPAGTVAVEKFSVLIRTVDVGVNEPFEGMKITVGGKEYRCAVPELSSDQTHYIISLNDVYG